MSKGNIAGIHNFCDRWCERCVFTSRCAVYLSESTNPVEQKDQRNKVLWERLSKNFEKARFLLEDAAKKSGLDLKDLQANLDETERKEEELRTRSLDHHLSRASLAYHEATRAWLKTQPGNDGQTGAIKGCAYPRG
jgi:hypothetical protein